MVWASSADFGRLSKEHFKYQNPFFCHHRPYLFFKDYQIFYKIFYKFSTKFSIVYIEILPIAFSCSSDKVLITEDLLNTR